MQADETTADLQRKLARTQQQCSNATEDSYAWKAQATSAQAAAAKLEERLSAQRQAYEDKLGAKTAEVSEMSHMV